MYHSRKNALCMLLLLFLNTKPASSMESEVLIALGNFDQQTGHLRTINLSKNKQLFEKENAIEKIIERLSKSEEEKGKEKIKHLNLNGCGLTSLPDNISKLKSINELEINDNNIRKLPDSLGELTLLSQFKFNNNKNLSELPDTFKNFKIMDTLHFSGCNFKKIPRQLSHLTALRGLNFSCRDVTDIVPVLICLQKLNTVVIHFVSTPENPDLPLENPDPTSKNPEEILKNSEEKKESESYFFPRVSSGILRLLNC